MKALSIFLIGLWLAIAVTGEAQTTKKKPTSKQQTNTSKTQTKSKTPAKSPAKNPAKTQTSKQEAAKEPAVDPAGSDEKKVRDIVAFLEFVLNTLGSSETPARDKDVVVTESYSKIFRDAKVQVEDDLDQGRTVITNKDVTAYLKDVDFFFNDVKFTFEIDGIQTGQADGNQYYKVSLTRNLAGTTSEGESVNNNSPRFIELNYDPLTQDLKIVSIYTKGFDEKQGMLNWWSEMSYEWQALFRKKTGKSDSVSLSDIRDMMAITELDLSNNKFIQDIEPVARLASLQKLNLSGTSIADIVPVRNLTELVEVNLSGTPVKDISVLKYSSHITKLNIANTDVTDISVVTKMPLLADFDASGSGVSDLFPLSDLVSLEHLNISGTPAKNHSVLKKLTGLKSLDVSATGLGDLSFATEMKALTELSIDSTKVVDPTPLAQLQSLVSLNISSTTISSLDALKSLMKLQKVYCDRTPIRQPAADAFMASRPGVLVVYDSKDLRAWWETLSLDWREILFKDSKAGTDPSKDELARITNIDSINLRGNPTITDLEPLRRMLRLKVIVANGTGIKDLSPLKDHREVRVLDITDTDVSDISILSKFSLLTILKADRTNVQDIDQLASLKSIKRIYADETGLHDIHASDFLAKNPDVLLVYKTYHVERWWSRLAAEWKTALKTQLKLGDKPTREDLHTLVEQRTLTIGEAQVSELSSLSEFVRLEELKLANTSIVNLSTLANLSIKTLHVTNSPLQSLDGIAALPDLRELDISNTPISDLRPMSKLNNLSKFSCAGTQVRKLDYLELLSSLEYLDCSNTSVSRLDGVANLPLKTFKAYNTNISARQMDKFRQSHPDCQVVFY